MKEKKKRTIIGICLIVVLLLSIVGVSYAAFHYTGIGRKTNQITTATIYMDYKESDRIIQINKALPTTDETGKIRLVEGEYFDFSVTTKVVGSTIIHWEIAAEDLDGNTFDGKNVKFYLTKLVGGEEIPVSDDLPKVYQEETTRNKYTGRPANMMSLLVGSTTTQGEETTNYRLRLYVDENYNPQGDGGNLVFKSRVNVYGLDTVWHQVQTEEGVTIEEEDASVGQTVHFEVEEKPGYTYDGAEIINSKGEVIDTVPSDKKEFVMPDEEIRIKIKWKANTYQISTEEVIGGRIEVKESADYESTVTITPKEEVGYQYDGVIITEENGNTIQALGKDETSFKMPMKNIKLTPKFIKIVYKITKEKATGGSITLGATSATVGDKVTFTTTQDTGYQYAGATVTYGSSTINVDASKKEFTMPASNVTVTPKFSKINYTITNKTVTGGTITIASTSTYNASVTFTTNASTGYQYNGATVTNSAGTTVATLNSSTRSFTMPDANVTITPKFSKINYTITNQAVTGGTITVGNSATMGSTVSFSTSPSTGYQYNGATIKNSSGEVVITLIASQKSFTMPASNVTITPIWEGIPIMRSYADVVQNRAYVEQVDYHADAYREKITTIVTKTDTNVPTTAIKQWDVSELGNNSVIAYIEDDGSGNGTYKVTIGGKGGIIANSDSSWLFYKFAALTKINLSSFNTMNVINMESVFDNCISLTDIDISNFDTSNVTNMYDMFFNCSSLPSLDLSHFDTSNVTIMKYMFANCRSLISLDLNHFDTSKVTDMSMMFPYCVSLTGLDVSHFDTSNVTNMRSMFDNCTSLTELNLSKFDTSKVTDMSLMFLKCTSLTYLNISSFDTSNVTDMSFMFASCNRLTNLDVSYFNTSNVTNMNYMFAYCSTLSTLDLSNFDTSKVTNMNYMFNTCSNLQMIKVGSLWITTNATTTLMFTGCGTDHVTIV